MDLRPEPANPFGRLNNVININYNHYQDVLPDYTIGCRFCRQPIYINLSCHLLLFLIYLSIAFAAVLPAPMARMTVAEPVTASPPAYTPCLVVSPVSSAIRQPLPSASRPPVVFRSRGFGDVPTAIMTCSTSSTNSEPGLTTGFPVRRRHDPAPFQHIYASHKALSVV